MFIALGTSGMWVCRGSAFCGMIVAVYPGEPLALFMTAEDLLKDMGTSFPVSRQPSLSNLLQSSTPIESEESDAIRNDVNRESTPDETLPKAKGSDSSKRKRSFRTTFGTSFRGSRRYEYRQVWTCVSTDYTVVLCGG